MGRGGEGAALPYLHSHIFKRAGRIRDSSLEYLSPLEELALFIIIIFKNKSENKILKHTKKFIKIHNK